GARRTRMAALQCVARLCERDATRRCLPPASAGTPAPRGHVEPPHHERDLASRGGGRWPLPPGAPCPARSLTRPRTTSQQWPALPGVTRHGGAHPTVPVLPRRTNMLTHYYRSRFTVRL